MKDEPRKMGRDGWRALLLSSSCILHPSSSSMRWLAAGLLAGALAAAGACTTSQPTPPTPSAEEAEAALTGPFFQDETARSGVKAGHRNGEEAGHYAILE